MNKVDLEKLINKPRAFRHHKIVNSAPFRQTIIILGSFVPENREAQRNYKKFKSVMSGGLFF